MTEMKLLLRLIAAIGLILTIVPAFLVFNGFITLALHKNMMVLGMLLWFVSVPFLLNKKTV
jgi:high-affinity Fe2+/Pb2+ permease